MYFLRWYNRGQDGGFRGWVDSQPDDFQGQLELVLEHLAAGLGWDNGEYFKALDGACDGLGEIRIEFDRYADGEDEEIEPEHISYRLLGYKTDGKREFTMLCGFQKISGSEYSRFCPMALRRKQKVQKDGTKASLWPL